MITRIYKEKWAKPKSREERTNPCKNYTSSQQEF
jgi:hypothetical protein